MENVNEIQQESIDLSPKEQPASVAVLTSVPTKPTNKVKKVIVAVHGIGDQFEFGTIQQVVNQFCTFYKEPAAVPLGMFHTEASQVAFSMPPPFPPKYFEQLAFAEVYWAKIPQKVVDDQHTLEQTQAWATTIVERLRLRAKKSENSGYFKDVDYERVKSVLLEMIQAVTLLERLCFLADRAGLFTFDLKKLLDDYLGDVQIVAEFEPSRRLILNTFHDVMDKVHQAYPEAELYVIAHSEGTVVSLLGLLEEANKAGADSWLNQVKGFMTFGSPIDKHLVLWPELFPANQTGQHIKRVPIEWRNYYDKGDPVGFELNDARDWLKKNNWKGLFDFKDTDDFGFIRYPFPGKAHVDYWTDPAVFGHFIKTVINPSADKTPTFPEPTDNRKNKVISYVMPYTIVVAILSVAVYILLKSVFNLKASDDNDDLFILKTVTAGTILLFGILVTARLPRLTRVLNYHLYALLVLCLANLAFSYLLPYETSLETWLFSGIPSLEGFIKSASWHLLVVRFAAVSLFVICIYTYHWWFPKSGIELFVLLAAVGICVLSYYFNKSIDTHKNADAENSKSLWPVLLASAAFFYLYWLAVLLFDLSFVWHFHIRTSFALLRMKAVRDGHAAN